MKTPLINNARTDRSHIGIPLVISSQPAPHSPVRGRVCSEITEASSSLRHACQVINCVPKRTDGCWQSLHTVQ